MSENKNQNNIDDQQQQQQLHDDDDEFLKQQQLSRLKVAGKATLARGAHESEDRILLRQTDSDTNRLSTSSFIRRRSPVSPSSKQDEEDSLSVTTTSDVNSDDDAASIVSRISQIVVEQEGKLMDSAHHLSAASKQQHFDQFSLCSELDDRPRSATLIQDQHIDQTAAMPKIKVQDSAEIEAAKSKPSRAFKDVREAYKRRQSAHEFKFGSRDNLPAIRANGSDGFLPERGDLRAFKNNRIQQQQQQPPISCSLDKEPEQVFRHRSNTLGSADNSSLLATDKQLMLNIRRSAWTLSDFDKEFNKSAEELCKSGQTSPISAGFKSASADQSSGQTSSNLHLLASKKATNLNQRLARHSLEGGNLMNRSHSSNLLTVSIERDAKSSPLANGLRRSSHCHSLISIATTVESCTGEQRQKRDSNLAAEPRSSSGCCNLKLISHYLPVLEWLPNYKLDYLWGDVMAGLTVAVLNISTSLSAAIVAQTSHSAAFMASIVNTFVYALLCSSRHISFGSWSIMSQMLLVSVRRALSDELILDKINLGPSASWSADEYETWHLNIIIVYTFLIGLFQLLCGLLNFGNTLASFIPEALCSSMIVATAFTMAVGQLANMCGTSNNILMSLERNTTQFWLSDLKDAPLDITDLFNGLFRWMQHIALLIRYSERINYVALSISVTCVLLLTLNQYVIQGSLERLFKRKILIPFEMILLVLMVILSYSLKLSENYNVTTCGEIQLEFVLPNLPDLRLVRELWFESIATALLSYTMVYIMAKSYGNKFNYELDYNQELVACGAGNLIGGLFDALPATASFSRTAGQVEAGGQTQMASLVNCVVLVALVKLLGHHGAALPKCVMAATLFYGFVRMMTRFREVFLYWRVCKVDFAIWVVTFAAILTLDLVQGFVYGFIFSILTMLYRAQK